MFYSMYPKKLDNGITILSEGCKIGITEQRPSGRKSVNCVCYCGDKFNTLLYEADKILGCINCRRKRQRKSVTKHGGYKTKIYEIWRNMVERCNNKNHPRYKDRGGRGIKILWKCFADFREDMFCTYKKGLTIERIDNDGNYCKENCTWVTPKQQAQNRRKATKTRQTLSDQLEKAKTTEVKARGDCIENKQCN